MSRLIAHPALQAQTEEAELASELLGIGRPQELEQFIGSLLSRAAGGAASLLSSPAGQQIGQMLQSAARQALPGIGRTLGGQLAGGAGRLLGLELEGLSSEDREFESARQFVRFARDAATRALQPGADAAAARQAFLDAARTYAPGLAAAARRAASFSTPATTLNQEPSMHNLDRVLPQQEMYNETAFGNEYEAGYSSEYTGEFEQFETGMLNEAELAAELLSVSNEAELDHFFGKIFKAVSGVARSPVGKIIGGALKQAAKAALPSLGAALGSAIPIPGVGTALGSMAGKALSNALEMETSGMSMEDREFEMAQGVVKLAASAARNASAAPAGANPAAVASQAIKSAVSALPGGGAAVAAGMGAPAPMGGARRNMGRWVRRGNTIVLLGV